MRIRSTGAPLWGGALLLSQLTGLLVSGAAAQAQVAFSDQTVAAGVAMTHSVPPPNVGGDFHTMWSGAAAGDFDRDGWTDLFVVGGGNVADKLYLNQRDGTFADAAAAWGIADLHVGAGAAVGDYDGDGWLDLFVTSVGDPADQLPGQHRLYRNQGGAAFVDVASQAGVNQTSPLQEDGFGACFGDYDLDGDLDLFVCSWRDQPAYSLGNRLFRNEGDGTFVDVTVDAGIDGHFKGFAPTFADMDGDRYPELLSTGDFYSSQYYVNQRDGTFRSFVQQAGLGLDHNGMGSTVADYDNDGDLDWLVSSIYLENGPMGFLGEGNKYYANLGGHRYQERAAAIGVDDGNWGWGHVAADVDHDGWLDIVLNNGFYYSGFFDNARVWINRGAALGFDDVAVASGFDHDLDGRGIVYLDYDNDGDLDFALTATRQDFKLYRNDSSGPGRNWLRVFLDTGERADLAPDGFGTRVLVRYGVPAGSELRASGVVPGMRTLMRYLDGGCHYLSTSELSLHFGLHRATLVDELRVEWTDGSVTTVRDVAANQTLTVRAPAKTP